MADAQLATVPYVVSRLRVAMGTFVALEAQAPARDGAEQALSQAWESIIRIEQLMHPDREGSDLARLAEAAVGTVVPVHPWTWAVLEVCRELYDATGGVFDPCVSGAGHFGEVELIAPSSVRLHRAVRLDLGGIAKGYAVDQALQALRRVGCIGGLINAGGDLATFGARSHAVYCGPRCGQVIFELKDGALASSDCSAAARPREHRGYYDGNDRARCVAGQVTITAPLAVWADALTKCALLLEPAQCEALLARAGARVILRTGTANAS
jgi:FAD:protein FMN transferase